jgi:hypothetical protein
MKISYLFDGECFDYIVDNDEVDEKLYQWLLTNWTREDLLDSIFDGCKMSVYEYFIEEIMYIFEEEAEECFNEQRRTYIELSRHSK